MTATGTSEGPTYPSAPWSYARGVGRSSQAEDRHLLRCQAPGAALANLAVADDYADWLYSQRGTVDPDLDLEL